MAVRIAEVLRAAEARLDDAGVDGARLQAVALLAHVLGTDRAGVLARLQGDVADEQAERFRDLVARRAARQPLQYLVGRAPFLDFEVAVGPGVLIPRPETELLVELALDAWDPDAGRWAVDVGTGSGVIALALARARPRARVCATELYDEALGYARRNVDALGLADRVLPVRSDLLSAVATCADIGLIVSNPPYAVQDEVVQPEVRDHEPPTAWEAGDTGVEAYERLLPAAAELLRPGRPLVLELGYGRESQVRDLLRRDPGWSPPIVHPDFQGIPRVLVVRRSPGEVSGP